MYVWRIRGRGSGLDEGETHGIAADLAPQTVAADADLVAVAKPS